MRKSNGFISLFSAIEALSLQDRPRLELVENGVSVPVDALPIALIPTVEVCHVQDDRAVLVLADQARSLLFQPDRIGYIATYSG